ncbi:hypothetical protein, partial [Ralstonia pseudosolanacearum]
MNAASGSVVVEVTLNVEGGSNGARVASVERVRDALGVDQTVSFRKFADQMGFDLTKQDQIEAAAAAFAEKFASI